MRALGFTTEKDSAQWAVVESNDQGSTIVAHDRMASPRAFEEADALAWFRERVQTLVRQYSPSAAAVRCHETYYPNPRNRPSGNKLGSMLMSARIQGVIVEALRSAGIPVGLGGWQQISSRMGSRSAKAYVESGEIRGIDLSEIPKVRHDAVATAISMLG